MEGLDDLFQSPSKKRRISEEISDDKDTSASGVVIWDIDDTIVVIQGSLKLAQESHQSDLVKCVKDYLFAYLEKEFYFSDTLHMKVVERLSEWDEEPTNVGTGEARVERHIETLLHQGASEITSKGSAYSTFLRAHYHSFQTSETASRAPQDTDCEEGDGQLLLNSAQLYDRLPPGWKGVFDAMESRTFLWTHHARTVLSHLKKKNVRNMIVTASEIAPAIAKLIMWGLFEYFDINDIYSSANKPKTSVFLHLLKDLGADSHPPQFVVACGDGPDEERASNHFSIPFQKIKNPIDLYAVPGLLSKEFAIPIPEKYFPQTEISSTVSPLSTIQRKSHDNMIKINKELLSECHQQLLMYTSDLRNTKKYFRDDVRNDDGITLEFEASQ